MERFDVVVVGARCAGSPLAAMLARRGLRVCLLDRARFPSDTPSTHVIQPCGVEILGRIGVLDAVLAAGAVPVDRFTLVMEDVRVEATAGEVATHEYGLCVRRVTLDALLVDAAAATGADVRTGTGVTGLVCDGLGRVAGVETDAGAIGAGVVVGADGRRSTVARLAGAAEYRVAPAGRVPMWAYFEGAPDIEGHLRLARLGTMAFLSCPTDGGLFMAGIAPSADDKDAALADRDATFAAGLRAWPELSDLVAGATRVGPIRVAANWHGYLRTPVGAGWALVGDAGHFKDPTPAQGISDALRQAEHLVGAIEAGLGGAAIDDELSRWGRWRDADAHEMHSFATDMGAPGPTTTLAVEVMRDIAGDAAATEQLLRVLNHEVRPYELFTPARVMQAMRRAAVRQPRRAPTMLREFAGALRRRAAAGFAVRGRGTTAPSPPSPVSVRASGTGRTAG